MGKYLNKDLKGNSLPAVGKYGKLVDSGAIPTDATFKPNLCCVVENGPFDACGWVFDELEFEAFTMPHDARPKRWLIIEGIENLVDKSFTN
jgi:hypothetical protein